MVSASIHTEPFHSNVIVPPHHDLSREVDGLDLESHAHIPEQMADTIAEVIEEREAPAEQQ